MTQGEDSQPSRPPGLGGIVHTYRGYDPVRFPPPSRPAGDGMAGLGDRMLASGSRRRFTPEELAEAIRIPPEAIAGLGPSIDALIEKLEERRRRILAHWNPAPTEHHASERVDEEAKPFVEDQRLPEAFRGRLAQEIRERQIRGLEQLWYHLDRDDPEQDGLRSRLPGIVESIVRLDAIEGLCQGWIFTGRTVPTIEEALEIREELETIERLLEQLREALEKAKPAIVDLDELRDFVEEADLEGFAEARQRAEELLEQLAEQEGLVRDAEGWSMGPGALRRYQSTLLASVFASMHGSRHGRHDPVERTDGAVELPATRPWEFGDPASSLDLPASIVNAVIRDPRAVTALRPEDMMVHRTRSTTKCATVVILDMSGSMRWGGQYVAAKKMALALEGLIRREYPGDRLHFIEMYSVARVVPRGGVIDLLPKPVTIRDPVVRLKADMSDPDIGESDLPPHFTNIQQALTLARRLLASADTPNRQVMLITDGLPTAHFEDESLYLLYPPDPRTEEATMREAGLLAREGGVLNVFLVPSWSQDEEDLRFGRRIAESTGGRVVFTAGDDLDRFVVWDYLDRRRHVVG